MKSIGILSFLILVFILSSCGGNEPERDKKKDASKGISLSSGDAMFPYFKRVPGLSALKRYTYGYMNINGKRVTDNRFRNAHTFTHGLGCVSIHRDDRIWYGFVNTSGEFEIDPTYTRARPFHEERAAVCKDTNLWLVIDTKGKELTQAKYSLLSDYHNGVCYGYIFTKKVQKRGLFKRSKEKSVYDCYRIDKKGNETLMASEVSDVSKLESSTLAHMDYLGMYWLNDANDTRSYGYKKLTQEEFKQSPLSSCGNYLNKGMDQIKAQFKDAECFEGGYARVKLRSDKSAYIDTSGAIICTFSDDR